jgi:hypothetical protein
MVMRYGMTEAMGPMVYAENEGEVFLGRSVTKTTNMSEETMQRVDAEVRRIIDEQYALARRLIEENSDKMHAMAKALLDWETIDGRAAGRHHGRPGTAPAQGLDAAHPTHRRPQRRHPRRSQAGRAGADGGLTNRSEQPDAKGAKAARRARKNDHLIFVAFASFAFSVASFASGIQLGRHMIWQTTRFAIDLGQPRVMGIVNVTPDSFSDGGAHADTDSALRHCERLLAEGADMLDIGGESTRPGSPPLPLADELAACCRCCAARLQLGVPVSVDTYKPEVMRAALDLGADIVNDVWALRQPGATGRGGAPPVLRRLPDAHAPRPSRPCKTRP